MRTTLRLSIASEVDCSSLMAVSQAISVYNRCSNAHRQSSAQDDREIRQNAQKHADLAIAYELASYVMEAHSSTVNALYYRRCANAEVASIPVYLHGEYRQQLSRALYVNGYLR